MKVLIGKSEIKDSLKKLDWPIQVLMATAVNAKVINTVDDKVTLVDVVATSVKVFGRRLDELPDSEPLDGTYVRVLQGIKKPNRDHARRLLHCLAATTHPLCVEELAEVGDAEGIPKMKPEWSWAIEHLFDPDKPHFAAWLKNPDIDTEPGSDSSLRTFSLRTFAPDHEPASPLYYAALWGFQDLVQLVLDKYPQLLNSRSGWYVTPLVAALARRHFHIVEFLYQNGADVDVPGFDGITPLISATWFGDLDMIQCLLDYKANVNRKTNHKWSALHYVSMRDPLWCRLPRQWFSNIAHLLLQHGADVDARGDACITPLHMAVINRRVEVVRVLLEHGASVDAEDDEGKTPSEIAAASGYDDIMEVLLEYGAK